MVGRPTVGTLSHNGTPILGCYTLILGCYTLTSSVRQFGLYKLMKTSNHRFTMPGNLSPSVVRDAIILPSSCIQLKSIQRFAIPEAVQFILASDVCLHSDRTITHLIRLSDERHRDNIRIYSDFDPAGAPNSHQWNNAGIYHLSSWHTSRA